MSTSSNRMMTVNWMPDRTSQISLADQIAGHIGQKIAQGEWLVGGRLPSQRKLAETFGVNRSTVIEAMEILQAHGMVEGRTGHGTRIVNNTWSLMVSAPPPNWHDYMDSGIYKSEPPTLQALRRLEMLEGVIRLSTDEMSPDLFPKSLIEESLKQLPVITGELGQADPLGSLRLRKAISVYMLKHGVVVDPACILITNGSLQALQLISVGMLAPGSKVNVDAPSYLKALSLFQSAGMKLEGIPMDMEGLIPWMIPDNHRASSTTLLYTMPTFHNPTGAVMSEERRMEVLSQCQSKRMPILEDDAYRELWLESVPPKPLKSLDDSGNVLYLGSAVKPLAPAIQLGWIIGPEQVVERLGEIRQQLDTGSNILMQHAFAEMLESGAYDGFVSKLRAQLKKRRDFTLMVLEDYFKDLATWNKPTGGPYIWLRLKKRISMERLFRLALDEKLVIHPGEVYDFSQNHCLRLSYAYASLTDLEKGLQRLSHLVRKMGH